MKIAVTNHAVDRYIDRVKGAKGFEREAVRDSIRKIVEDGFAEGMVQPHPLEEDRRVVPFKSGESILYLSLGPNTTTYKEADLAVISVLYEHELTPGKVGLDITLEDVASDIRKVKTSRIVPQFIVVVDDYIETKVIDEYALVEFVKAQREGARIDIYELKKGE